jgi:hypothetical protein
VKFPTGGQKRIFLPYIRTFTTEEFSMSRLALPALTLLAIAAAPALAQNAPRPAPAAAYQPTPDTPAPGSCAEMMVRLKTTVSSLSPMGQSMAWTEFGLAQHALEARNEDDCKAHMQKALAMK